MSIFNLGTRFSGTGVLLSQRVTLPTLEMGIRNAALEVLFLQWGHSHWEVYTHAHRFTYPKGIHSYRFFLQLMCTANSLPPVHAY